MSPRELLLAALVVALVVGWYLDHSHLAAENIRANGGLTTAGWKELASPEHVQKWNESMDEMIRKRNAPSAPSFGP